MRKTRLKDRYMNDSVLGLNVFFLSILCSWIQLGLRTKDLGLAWLPSSDLLSNYLQSSGIHENKNRWNYPRINLPVQSDLGMNMSPQFDWVHQVLLQVFNLVTRNPVVSVNVWILLSFGLTSVFAFVLMRLMGISRFTTVVCSLVFGLLPYHFIRMQHATVIHYQWAPCLIFVLITIVDESILRIQRRTRVILLVFSCLLISGSGAYALFYSLIFVTLFSLLKLFTNRKRVELRICVPFLLLAVGALIQIILFRILMDTNSQQLLYPKRDGGDAILYSTRAFEFFIPSITSPWYDVLFAWIGRKIEVPNVNLCPPGEFSKYATYFVCNAKVEGGTYGSLVSTIGIYIAVIGGVFLLVFNKEVLKELRVLYAILLVAFLLVTSYGVGTILAALVPAARKTGILTPFVTLLAIVIAAILIERCSKNVKKLYRNLFCVLIMVFLVSESIPSRYSQIEETRDSQELIRKYSKRVDQTVGSDCSVLRIPLSFPSYDPAAVSPGEYLPAIYSDIARWVFVDTDVTSIEKTNLEENLWWIVGSARAKGYCAIELSNRSYEVANGVDFKEVAEILEREIGLERILESKDRNIRLYTLSSGRTNEMPLVNILDGGYVREPVDSGGAWRWVKSKVRYRFLSSVRQCVQIKSHVSSFGGASHVKFFLDGFEIVKKPTDVLITTNVTLNVGINILRIETSGGDKLLSNGQMGAAYIFDPTLKKISPELCR